MADQRERAELFGGFHRGPDILIVLNAWDAGSARVFELAGARAIATTSGGLAAAHGYPDGERMPLALLAQAVAEITRVVSVPVSVDLETGFGRTPQAAAQAAELMLNAGAVGINIEDGSEAPELLVEKIAAIGEMARGRGIPLFINARTDVYLRRIGDEATRTDESLRRLAQYAAAGAGGGFVIGQAGAGVIARLAKESPLPLNVMVQPGTPTIPELRAMGVRRVSIGGSATYAALSLARQVAQELLTAGTYSALFGGRSLTYPEVNRMFEQIP